MRSRASPLHSPYRHSAEAASPLLNVQDTPATQSRAAACGNSPGRNQGVAMEQQSLRELYVDNPRDMYSAEKQILRALPKMIKGAANEEWANGLEEHRTVTEQQVVRLERIFRVLGTAARTKKGKGM